MPDFERKVRRLGRKEFIKFREHDGNITAYMFDGISREHFTSWIDAYNFLRNAEWKQY